MSTPWPPSTVAPVCAADPAPVVAPDTHFALSPPRRLPVAPFSRQMWYTPSSAPWLRLDLVSTRKFTAKESFFPCLLPFLRLLRNPESLLATLGHYPAAATALATQEQRFPRIGRQ